MVAATEKQDCLGIGVEKVDFLRGAGNDDPSTGPQFCVHVGPEPPISAALVGFVSVGSDSSVDEPAIENHLHLRVVAKRVAERLAQVQFGSRYDNDEGLRDLLFGDGGTRVTWHTQFLPGGDQAYSRPGNIREFFFCVQLASEPVRKLALIYHLLNLAMAAGDQLRYSVPRASCSALRVSSAPLLSGGAARGDRADLALFRAFDADRRRRCLPV
jgi:hypothetical protein